MAIKCRNCGAAISDGVTICPYCDTEITFETRVGTSEVAPQDISGISFELRTVGKGDEIFAIDSAETIKSYLVKWNIGELDEYMEIHASQPIYGIDYLGVRKVESGDFQLEISKNDTYYEKDEECTFEELLSTYIDFYEGKFNPDLEEEQLTPAQKLFNIGTIQQGALEIFKSMCACINNGRTLEEYMEFVNDMARESKEYFTNDVNANILRIAETNVSQQFVADEKSVLYIDKGVFSKGKDGFLVTNKAIYRIKKKGCAKVCYEEFHSLQTTIGTIVHFCVNGNYDFGLCAFSSDKQFGVILGMICTLARDNNSAGYKIIIGHIDD